MARALTGAERAFGYGPPRDRPEEPEHPFSASLVYQGIPLDIEHLKGETRSGVSPDGIAWSVRMPAAYGEVRGTVGADGDAVDVYVGPERFAPLVYVIQAKYPRSRAFDETKSMLGFATQQDAVDKFRAAYNIPGFFHGVTTWPIGSWREAMQRHEIHGGPMRAPLTKAVVDLDRFAAQLAAERGTGPMVSQFEIGDPVVFEIENPAGTPVASPSTGALYGHVRAVTFTAGKVRYSILVGNDVTTLHNVDSAFVRPWDGGLRRLFAFDNYS